MWNILKPTMFDLDLQLIESRDDDCLPWSKRALAGLSVGVSVAEGLHDAEELHQAVYAMTLDQQRGRRMLNHILEREGAHYQRALWYSLAGRGLFEANVDLTWLVRILTSRSTVAFSLLENGIETKPRHNPYAVA